MKQTLEIDGRTYWGTRTILDAYGITEGTLYRWINRRLMPDSIRIGNRRFYPKDEVERRMSRGE